MENLKEVILGRKSVRSFDGTPLRREEREKLERFMETAANPFGVPVRFVLLDAKEHGLSSPVLTGEPAYAAGMVRPGPWAELAYGYSFELLVLCAWSLGVGTAWIGGTMKREHFEREAGKEEGELMPCVTPLGYPAKKRSLKELAMRRAVGADTRLPPEKLFFDGAWGAAMGEKQLAALGEVPELTRWAPSAVNKQPWRIVAAGGSFHFYEKQDKGYAGEKTGDLQRIDVGIALCHFVLALEAQGRRPEVIVRDPGITVPADVRYAATVTA